MNSTINLYKNCLVTKDKNFILDTSGGYRAIAQYLSTLTDTLTIAKFQYIKHQLSLSIKVDLSQTNLNMGGSVDDINYCSIRNGTEKIFYYFIISKIWRSASTIELVLSMDTLNTFGFNTDYSVSNKSLIKRQHKDRFKKIATRTITHYVHLTIGQSEDDYYYTDIELAFSSPINIVASSSNPSILVTTSVVTQDDKKYILVHSTTFVTPSSGTITISYDITALEAVIDLKSEEINVPVYKKEEEILYDSRDVYNIDWALYYKTADNQVETPIDCYLIPSDGVNIEIQANSGVFDNNNVPNNKYLYFFESYNTPALTFDFDGVTFTPTSSNDAFRVLALYNDNGVVKGFTGVFAFIGNTLAGFWNPTFPNPTTIKVLNAPSIIHSFEESYQINANDIQTDTLWLSENATHSTNMGALSQTSLPGKANIDKTLSTNIKIINIPYSPTPYEVKSSVYTFDSCWEYDGVSSKMKLVDFNKKFNNAVTTSSISILKPFIVDYTGITLTNDFARTFKDTKLLHSDYYRPKFIYDSFSKIFPLEQMNYSSCDKALNFGFTFVMSRNIVSKFLFMFNQFGYKYSKEDYENIVAVSRNNEEVLYNSQYLDYIRTGYNYDLKAKERTETASGIGIGLNVAGLLASIGIGVATQNPIAVASVVATGISLVGQLVNYAKTTAQNEENIQKKLQETQMQAVSVMNADDYDLLYEYTENKAKYALYKCSDRMEKILDDLFFYCGYVVNEQGIPETQTRRSFNFVQASLIIIETKNLTSEIEEDIKEKFEQGVTFLHYSFNKFDFAQDKENLEVSLLS